MNKDNSQDQPAACGSRREFLKTTSALAVASSLPIAKSAHAAGSEDIRIALVGCGGRGTGAADQALNANPNVKLIAMADAFRDRLDSSLRSLTGRHTDRVDVPEERKFVALNAIDDVLSADPDVVLLCTPPGFRPLQFEAAVEAGKHVFMEKPVATDAPGVRRIMAANEKAKAKGLAVAVGHHLRHEEKHTEVVKRIHDGAIGDVHHLRAYFNSGGVWVRDRLPGQTELEYQVRNWYYFNWVCGDHIVEQHVHDLDVCNWIKRAHPVEAQGTGGRQVRKGREYGEIFDHHAVEFTYEDGSKMSSYCRHMPNCWDSFSQHAHGTNGSANIEGHGTAVLNINGQEPLRWRRGKDGHQVEQDDFFAALVAGQPYNEGDHGATSTMTAIMGRMATYSGKVVSWEQAISSDVDLMPERLAWDAAPQSKPDENGIYPCAIPGVTKAF